jgi:hypothetical protein
MARSNGTIETNGTIAGFKDLSCILVALLLVACCWAQPAAAARVIMAKTGKAAKGAGAHWNTGVMSSEQDFLLAFQQEFGLALE